MYNFNDIIVDYRSKGTKFLKNERFTHSEVSLWIHCDQQKTPSSTEEVTEKKTKANKEGESQKMTYTFADIVNLRKET